MADRMLGACVYRIPFSVLLLLPHCLGVCVYT